jgi:hypothetical protein
MFSGLEDHCVPIDLVQTGQTPEPSNPPCSDLPYVHDPPAPRRSTAEQHPSPPLTADASERPGSEAKSEESPFVGWTLTLPPAIEAGNPSAVSGLETAGVDERDGGSEGSRGYRRENVRAMSHHSRKHNTPYHSKTKCRSSC